MLSAAVESASEATVGRRTAALLWDDGPDGDSVCGIGVGMYEDGQRRWPDYILPRMLNTATLDPCIGS